MFTCLLVSPSGVEQNLLASAFGKIDQPALLATMEKLDDDLENVIAWAATVYECANIKGHVKHVKIVFHDDSLQQHPGFVCVRVENGRLIFNGEGKL
jgi:hypothetical protein